MKKHAPAAAGLPRLLSTDHHDIAVRGSPRVDSISGEPQLYVTKIHDILTRMAGKGALEAREQRSFGK
jgi:hypothetical protein